MSASFTTNKESENEEKDYRSNGGSVHRGGAVRGGKNCGLRTGERPFHPLHKFHHFELKLANEGLFKLPLERAFVCNFVCNFSNKKPFPSAKRETEKSFNFF